ncbi:hypothetical protein, partial [Klebsiella pneumoniae]
REGVARLSVDLRPDLDAGALAQRWGRARQSESTATRLRKAAGLSPVAAGLVREATGNALPSSPERV